MERWMDVILKCERDWRIHKRTCASCKPGELKKYAGECTVRVSISELALQACLISTGYIVEVRKAMDTIMGESW